jgi:hypothetical protein
MNFITVHLTGRFDIINFADVLIILQKGDVIRKVLMYFSFCNDFGKNSHKI